ncbi:MAG: CHAT domain-containing protein [Kovacikia sp.]
MRFVNLIRYLSLGISTALLILCLARVSPAPAIQKPVVPAPSAAPAVTPQSTSLQQVQEGNTRYQNGQFSDAVTLWKKAAASFETTGDRLNQAMVLSNLALAYQQLGQMPLAHETITKGLQILGCPASGMGCPTAGPEHTRITAQALNTLGSLQLAQGQFEQAFATWQQAGDRYQQVNNQAGVVRAQINQAQALQAGGLYRRAAALLQPISQSLEKQADPTVKISGLISYGDALRRMGNLKQSQTVLENGLKLAQQQRAIADTAAAYLSLGNTSRAQIRSGNRDSSQLKDTALHYYQQAADIAPNTTVKIQAQLNQLSLLIENKSWQGAQTLAQQILPQLPGLPASRTKTYAQISYASNLIQLAAKDAPSGYGRLCQEQTALDRPMLYTQGKDTQGKDTQGNDAATGKAKNLDPTIALDQITRPFSPLTTAAYTLADAIRQSSAVQDWQAKAFALGYLGHAYETDGRCSEALDLTLQALKLAQSHKAFDIAYRWEWQTGRLYRDLATTQATSRDKQEIATSPAYQNAIAAYRAAFVTLQDLRRDLAAGNADAQFNFQEQTEEPIYREFVDLLLRPKTPSQANLVQARMVIESLQIAELENFLQEPCVASNAESIDRVADEANSTTAALFPIILKDRIEVILKLPRQKDLLRYSYAITEAQVSKIIEQFYRKLQLNYGFETVKVEAKAVYDWLLAQARTQLEAAKIDTLVFVPDSKLRNVPMSALYDGKQFLVENFATTVALNLQLQNPKPLPKQLRVLAASLTDPPADFRNFAKLENVNKELTAIANAGITVIPIQDKQFTTQAFNQKINQSSFSIVHLATHGQFSSDPQKTFLLTASGSIKVDDLGSLFRTRGLNRTDEIELLVLSACETASGDNRATLGIAGTTVRAGARSAIASLWSLDDESSVELMKQFYQRLGKGNISRAEALRQAQLALINNKQYAYPRYWAPLILLGNWL